MVVDGHNLAYRAFFAVPHLTTRAGLPTNALFGFISMLLKAISLEKPDYIFVAFDPPSPT
ncbi:MAG: PIN domain-containing protein, partial [Candidatus Margulisiibacteriota bacterium]